jgi:hypothetical protein
MKRIICSGLNRAEILELPESDREKHYVSDSVSKPSSQKNIKFKKFDNLEDITGIGKETVADIKTMYPRANWEKFIADLKKNKVALRNDVVNILKKVILK